MASFENVSNVLRSRTGKSILTAGVATLALGLAGCSANKQLPPAAAPTPQTQPTQPVTLTPDMSGFLKPGSTTTCFNGGDRPCAILIRTKPELSSSIINADPTANQVTWPREAFNGQPGNAVTIKCYTANGQKITPYEGNTTSTDWYEVVVPVLKVKNPAVKTELTQPNSSVQTVQYGGETAILGWASVEWFNQSSPDQSVPQC